MSDILMATDPEADRLLDGIIDGFTAIIGNYGPTLAALGLDFKDVEAVSLTVNGTSVATESSVTRLGADRWSLPLSVRTASQTLSTAPGAL